MLRLRMPQGGAAPSDGCKMVLNQQFITLLSNRRRVGNEMWKNLMQKQCLCPEKRIPPLCTEYHGSSKLSNTELLLVYQVQELQSGTNISSNGLSWDSYWPIILV